MRGSKEFHLLCSWMNSMYVKIKRGKNTYRIYIHTWKKCLENYQTFIKRNWKMKFLQKLITLKCLLLKFNNKTHEIPPEWELSIASSSILCNISSFQPFRTFFKFLSCGKWRKTIMFATTKREKFAKISILFHLQPLEKIFFSKRAHMCVCVSLRRNFPVNSRLKPFST